MKAKNSTIDIALLRNALSYNPSTGCFTWRTGGSGGCLAGQPAGCVRTDGYVAIRFRGERFKAHRLAWLYVHGRWPIDQLDHINGVRNDNRIENLRECSNSENAQNRSGPRSDNKTSGLIGTCLKRGSRWQAQICLAGKKHFIGYFDTAQEAHAAYLKAKRDLHPLADIERLAQAGERRKSSEGSASAVLALATTTESAA